MAVTSRHPLRFRVRRRALVLLTSFFILAAAPAAVLNEDLRAEQDVPPPQPRPGPVSLLYRHRPGSVQRFRLETKVDGTVTPEGAPGLQPVPVTSKSQIVYMEKVAGTRDGAGTIALTILIDSDAPGKSSATGAQSGKGTKPRRGRPARADAPGPIPQPGASGSNVAPRRVIMLKRDARGVTVTETGAVPGLSGGVGNNVAQFPDHPVRVGDTWETVQKVRPSVPDGPGPEFVVRFTHTLKDVVERGGRKLAVIESSGSGSTPAGTEEPTAEQRVTGTTWFDIERGVVVSGQYVNDHAVRFALPRFPPVGMEAENSPTSLRIAGKATLSLSELPAAVPAPVKNPTPKKPAAKKPARKR
jgi:hypothetical protein